MQCVIITKEGKMRRVILFLIFSLFITGLYAHYQKMTEKEADEQSIEIGKLPDVQNDIDGD